MALEQQLAAGDYLYGFEFTDAVAGGPPGLVSKGVVDGTMKVKRVATTIKKRALKKNKVVTTVQHSEVKFRWLPWVNGKINYANLEGKDVLSGMFTGCWMALYKEDGNFRVCHIATTTDATDCKATWRKHKTLPNVSSVKEFKPDSGLASARNLGLVTATGELWKIELADERDLKMPNPWRTSEEWMDPAKGRTTKEFAAILANEDEVSVAQVYPGTKGFRIAKLVGPLAPEHYPTD